MRLAARMRKATGGCCPLKQRPCLCANAFIFQQSASHWYLTQEACFGGQEWVMRAIYNGRKGLAGVEMALPEPAHKHAGVHSVCCNGILPYERHAACECVCACSCSYSKNTEFCIAHTSESRLALPAAPRLVAGTLLWCRPATPAAATTSCACALLLPFAACCCCCMLLLPLWPLRSLRWRWQLVLLL